MKIMLRYISFALISVLLFGCGQKGPLYLPKEPVENEQPDASE
jgi:predicted small lipoprotein YifL